MGSAGVLETTRVRYRIEVPEDASEVRLRHTLIGGQQGQQPEQSLGQLDRNRGHRQRRFHHALRRPLTRQAMRRGSFKELVAMIDAFVQGWNAGASPFAWVKTPDEILAKAVRKPRAIRESGH